MSSEHKEEGGKKKGFPWEMMWGVFIGLIVIFWVAFPGAMQGLGQGMINIAHGIGVSSEELYNDRTQIHWTIGEGTHMIAIGLLTMLAVIAIIIAVMNQRAKNKKEEHH